MKLSIKHLPILILVAIGLVACGPSTVSTPESETAQSTETEEKEEPTDTAVPSATVEVAEVYETETPPTDAPAPELACVGIFKQDLFMYPIPNEAMTGKWLSSGAYVQILGQLNEPVWYQVKLFNDIGWVLQYHVKLDDPNCTPHQLSLAEALELQGTPVLDDTFRDSQNWSFLNNPDKRPDRQPNSINNYTLNIDAYFERTELSAPAIKDVAPFELATAYWRQNGSESTSYVGIQYGNETQYLEVRVLGNCDIEILTSDGFYEKQATRSNNLCKDDTSDFLFVRWDGVGLLEVGQNDMEVPYRFNIGNPVPATGKIQLIADEARAQFDFIAVTEN